MVFQCSVLARSAFRNSFMSWALEFIFMSATHSFAPDRSLRRDCNQFTKPRLQEIFISTKEALVWSPVRCLHSARPLYACACAALHPAWAYLCLFPLPAIPAHSTFAYSFTGHTGTHLLWLTGQWFVRWQSICVVCHLGVSCCPWAEVATTLTIIQFVFKDLPAIMSQEIRI